MNPGMKMMMVSTRNRNGNKNGGRYETELQNRNGMIYGNMDSEVEARRRYRRDSRGRFRSEMDEMDRGKMGGYEEGDIRSEMRGYPNRPFPVYEGGGSNMNPIGFDPYREVETNYRMNATHHTGNEMEHRSGVKMGGGYASNESPEMTKELAEEWTSSMKNSDGTRGEHWSYTQTRQLMAQKGIECDPWEFYVVMNMLYSDYCAVLKKHGINNIDVYTDLACAWLKDTDAVPNKTAEYYENVVKKG